LRLLLGCYLRLPASKLGFIHNALGKPELAAAPGESILKFNLSYSHQIAVCAIALRREVGIDIEWSDPDFPWAQHAEDTLTDDERFFLESLPADERRRA